MKRLDGTVSGLSILFGLAATNGQSVQAQLDTGFTGQIAADSATLSRLGFEGPVAQTSVELGDGSTRDLLVYSGSLSWFGGRLDVQAILAETPECTMGMSLVLEAVIHVEMPRGTAYLAWEE